MFIFLTHIFSLATAFILHLPALWKNIMLYIENAIQYIQQESTHLIPYFLDFIIKYNQFSLFIKTNYNDLCVKYPSLNKIHIFICENFISIMNKIIYLKREPTTKTWHEICYCYAFNDSDISPDFDSRVVTEYQTVISHLIAVYKDIYELMTRVSKSYFPKEKLYIIRDEKGNTHIDILTLNISQENIKNNTTEDDYINSIVERKVSRVKFLAITYKHPRMDTPINIEIDTKWMLVGNSILSSCFVWRYIQMQPFYIVATAEFDLLYELHIMDNNCNMFVLKSNQYILLDRLDYKVLNL